MRLRAPHRRGLATAVTLLATGVGSIVALSVPADAGDREVIRRGSCSGSTDWKLKAKEEDGRIEVEAEIDSNRTGQSWSWKLLHNGDVTARGTKTTRAPSGSFEVGRLMVDLAGDDHIKIRATHGGETCRGSVVY